MTTEPVTTTTTTAPLPLTTTKDIVENPPKSDKPEDKPTDFKPDLGSPAGLGVSGAVAQVTSVTLTGLTSMVLLLLASILMV